MLKKRMMEIVGKVGSGQWEGDEHSRLIGKGDEKKVAGKLGH